MQCVLQPNRQKVFHLLPALLQLAKDVQGLHGLYTLSSTSSHQPSPFRLFALFTSDPSSLRRRPTTTGMWNGRLPSFLLDCLSVSLYVFASASYSPAADTSGVPDW